MIFIFIYADLNWENWQKCINSAGFPQHLENLEKCRELFQSWIKKIRRNLEDEIFCYFQHNFKSTPVLNSCVLGKISFLRPEPMHWNFRKTYFMRASKSPYLQCSRWGSGGIQDLLRTFEKKGKLYLEICEKYWKYHRILSLLKNGNPDSVT